MYQQQEQPRPAVNPFLCYFISILTGIVIFLGVIILIVFRPRIPEFQVDSGTVSLNFTGNHLTAKWDITLTVTNPNKKLDVAYRGIYAGVFYGNDKNDLDLITSSRLVPMYQPTRSKILVHVQFVGDNVSNSIAVERDRGLVPFGVVLNTLIKRNGLFHPKDRVLKVVCNPLNFVISTDHVNGALLRPVNCRT